MNIKDKIKLTQNIAVVTGIFCVTVALLLLLNYWQMTKSDPTDSQTIKALVERLKQDPNDDALKMEIRNFDLLARKAYFNSRWQVKTGGYMLLFGAIVLAFALRFYYSLKAKIDQPDTVHENEITSRILAQKGVIIVGSVLMILAFLASFATVNYLDYYDATVQVAETDQSATDEGIEVVDVGTQKDTQEQTEDLTFANQPTTETPQAVEENMVASDESGTTEKKVAETAGLTLATI